MGQGRGGGEGPGSIYFYHRVLQLSAVQLRNTAREGDRNWLCLCSLAPTSVVQRVPEETGLARVGTKD